MSQPMRSCRGLLAAGVSLLLVACAQPPKPLYHWEAFPRQQYEALLREGASPEGQIQAMEAHAEKARATGLTLPPGFRAHLGMLHLSAGNADAARTMWQAEKAAFPESGPYLDRLLGRMSAPAARPVAKDNPT